MLGVYAPYNFSETTQLAIAVANLGMSFGAETDYLAIGAREQGVHSFWDTAASTDARVDFRSWLARCSHVVWTDVQPDKLGMSMRMGRKNILLLQWHMLSARDEEHLGKFDSVVCPSPAILTAMCRRWPQLKNIVGCSWSPCCPILEPRTSPANSRILLAMNGRSAALIGARVMHASQVMLESEPNLEITVLYTKNWARRSLDAVTELQRSARGRVSVLRKPSVQQRLLSYTAHDWLFWPTAYEGSGHIGLEALYSGLPVISLDVPPVTDFLRQSQSVLVPCEHSPNWLGMPEPSPRTLDLLQGLHSAIHDRKATHSADWDWRAQRHAMFVGFWRRMWDFT